MLLPVCAPYLHDATATCLSLQPPYAATATCCCLCVCRICMKPLLQPHVCSNSHIDLQNATVTCLPLQPALLLPVPYRIAYLKVPPPPHAHTHGVGTPAYHTHGATHTHVLSQLRAQQTTDHTSRPTSPHPPRPALPLGQASAQFRPATTHHSPACLALNGS